MLLQRIQQQFIDSADLKYQCAQALAPMVEAATAAVLASVTGGGKVLSCGNGASAAAAQLFAASWRSRTGRSPCSSGPSWRRSRSRPTPRC